MEEAGVMAEGTVDGVSVMELEGLAVTETEKTEESLEG